MSLPKNKRNIYDVIKDMEKYRVVKNFNEWKKSSEWNSEWNKDFKKNHRNLKNLINDLLKQLSATRNLNIKYLKEIVKLKEKRRSKYNDQRR